MPTVAVETIRPQVAGGVSRAPRAETGVEQPTANRGQGQGLGQSGRWRSGAQAEVELDLAPVSRRSPAHTVSHGGQAAFRALPDIGRDLPVVSVRPFAVLRNAIRIAAIRQKRYALRLSKHLVVSAAAQCRRLPIPFSAHFYSLPNGNIRALGRCTCCPAFPCSRSMA